jgi:hypothetical protein
LLSVMLASNHEADPGHEGLSLPHLNNA